MLPAELIAAIKVHTDRAGISVEEFATVMLEDASENAEELIRELWVFKEAV